MNDTKERDSDSDSVRDVLASVDRLQAAAVARGVYSQAFGFGVALWTASLVTTFALGSGLFLLLFAAGLVVGAVWHRRERNRQGAWVNEVRSWGELGFVVAIAMLVTAVTLAALVAGERGLVWAPWAAGVFAFGTIYGLMNWAYGDVWAARREQSA